MVAVAVSQSSQTACVSDPTLTTECARGSYSPSRVGRMAVTAGPQTQIRVEFGRVETEPVEKPADGLGNLYWPGTHPVDTDRGFIRCGAVIAHGEHVGRIERNLHTTRGDKLGHCSRLPLFVKHQCQSSGCDSPYATARQGREVTPPGSPAAAATVAAISPRTIFERR